MSSSSILPEQPASQDKVPAARRLAILHWLPVELYPPTINLLRLLAKDEKWRVELFTSANHLGRTPFKLPGAHIHRSPAPGLVRGLKRAWAYASFQIQATWRLFIFRPEVILYFEPQSAFPVFLYRLIHPDVPIFVHHHEYHDPHLFLRKGMRLTRFFHHLEIRHILPKAEWISHTNRERLNLFLNDHAGLPPQSLKILPNYPPASWPDRCQSGWKTSTKPFPLKFVYIGSLSLRDTFLQEFIEWLSRLPQGDAFFEVYSYNLDAETEAFLNAADTRLVKFHRGGIDYDQIPDCLDQAHFGVLLYKANTTNYRFNASNKLFEYLACGLDVLFPDRMDGVKPYATVASAPRVIEADFSSLDEIAWSTLKTRTSLEERPFSSQAEEALSPLLDALKQAAISCRHDSAPASRAT